MGRGRSLPMHYCMKTYEKEQLLQISCRQSESYLKQLLFFVLFNLLESNYFEFRFRA